MWKNETSYLTRIPAALRARGTLPASLAATVVGLEAPPGSRNLEIKPYAIVGPDERPARARRRFRTTSAPMSGVDVKYGLTQNLTADFTYNTDFAQVEADEQQVNLTRFSLFFPEKREFFLENQGTFQFGALARRRGAWRRTTGEPERHADPVLQPSDRPRTRDERSPSTPGGRLTGRLGRFSVGAAEHSVGR